MQTPQNTQPATPKVRRLTVCNKSFLREAGTLGNGCVIFPIISLSGKWLQDCGFSGGHVIDIACEDRKLTITLAKEQRFEDI